MSFKPEVLVMGDSNWYSNSLRFGTLKEAEGSARDLHRRWTLTTGWRASYSDDPVNYYRPSDFDGDIPIPVSTEPPGD